VILLAALGREAPTMSLSAVECAQLAPLVETWFTRGATERDVTRALTTGLPAPVHHPAALARTRLVNKLPPEPPPSRAPLRLIECGKCGIPGRADALRDGDCASCRGDRPPARPPGFLSPAEVRAHAAGARRAAAERAPEAPAPEGRAPRRGVPERHP
jgi:hypothetical protein